MEIKNLIDPVVALSIEAGKAILAVYDTDFDVEKKADKSPLTKADMASNRCILRGLAALTPEVPIITEEAGLPDFEKRRSWSCYWLIDPLDGTNNFAHGFPHVGLSLALVADGQPVVGVIHDPLRGETFAAIAGGGATLDGRPIHVSNVEHLGSAFLATGFPYDRRTAPDNNVVRLDHFLRRSLGVRRAGAAVLDLAYVACGRFDGFWEIRLKPWDVAAGVLLVREAGGWVTDFEGGPGCLAGEFIVASNGHVHDQMLRVIREGAAAPRPDDRDA